jgi:alpha-L-arabinofuranosidase
MKKPATCILSLLLVTVLYEQRKLTVAVNKPGAPVLAQMWGIFFEDINFAAGQPVAFEIDITGTKSLKKEVTIQEISSTQPYIYNTLNEPAKIIPVEKKVTVSRKQTSLTVPPSSLSVIKFLYD